MEEMSPNGEGRISPRDFGWWLSDEGSANGFTRAAAEGFACDSPGHDATVAEDILSDANQGDRSVRAGLWGDQLEGQSHVAIRARKLLRLDCFNVNDLLEILAEVAVMVSMVRVSPPRRPFIAVCSRHPNQNKTVHMYHMSSDFEGKQVSEKALYSIELRSREAHL